MLNFALKGEQQRALRHLFEGKEFGKSLILLLVLVDVGGQLEEKSNRQ